MRGPECLPIHQITSTHTCSARANVWLYRLHVLWRRGVCPTYPQSFSQLFLGTGGGGKPRPHTCARLPIAASTLGLHNISVISVQGRRVSVSASTAHAESLGGSWGQIKMRHQHSQGAQREGGTGRARERYRRFVLHWPLSWRSSLNGSKGKAPRRHKIKF